MPECKRIHLVCNAHLDPVWQWPWQDGLAEAISTYRIAADFCERQRGFVFNHNEALLYHQVEQLEPELFQRIRKLVGQGRWHISGGAWLQPDVNGPGGESHIRHYLLGRRYFEDRFGRYPRTAYNFDPFGHPEGFAQILAGCGMAHYVFCRPDFGSWELPAGAFRWRDRSGAEVVARRSDDHYLTNGKIVDKLEKFVPHYAAEPVSMLLWGIGNHGGGPSQREYAELTAWREAHPELDCRDSTPDAFFAELLAGDPQLPIIVGEIQNSAPGCYTSMSRIKRAHRRVEDLLLGSERLAALAWWQGLAEWPAKDLDVAWKDLLYAQFHDILPGSCGETGERDSLRLLASAEETCERLAVRTLWACARRDERAAQGVTPVYVANRQGRAWRGQVEIECCLDHNPSACRNSDIAVRVDGRRIPVQRLQAETMAAGDWRVRLALGLELTPWQLQRCEVSYRPRRRTPAWKPPAVTAARLRFRSRRFTLQISPRTGLIERLQLPDGTAIAGTGAFAPVLFKDLDHSWRCGTPRRSLPQSVLGKGGFTRLDTAFRLASAAEAARLSPPGKQVRRSTGRPVRIVADGPLRTVVEVLLVAGPSAINRQYHLLHREGVVEIRDRVFMNHRDHMLKLAVPLALPAVDWATEACHSVAERPADPTGHFDQPVGRWIWLRTAKAGKRAQLAIASTATTGAALSATENTCYLNVLRSPAYASSGIKDETEDWRHHRFVPRHDQGEHEVRWRIACGARFTETQVRDLAEDLCMPPVWQLIFPVAERGDGRIRERLADSLVPQDPALRIVAVKRSEDRDELVVRLLNGSAATLRTRLLVKAWRRSVPLEVGPWALCTIGLRRGRQARWRLLDLVERPLER